MSANARYEVDAQQGGPNAYFCLRMAGGLTFDWGNSSQDAEGANKTDAPCVQNDAPLHSELVQS